MSLIIKGPCAPLMPGVRRISCMGTLKKSLVIVSLALSILLLLGSSIAAQQSDAPCLSPIEDVSEKDLVPFGIYRTLSIRSVSGYAIDLDNVRVPLLSLGIFSLKDKRLVASTTTDEEGRFQLPNIPPGKYRLVARGHGFCIAIVPLRIVRWPRGGVWKHRHLVLHMRFAALDECSYGSYR
jgi:hypothetical protein